MTDIQPGAAIRDGVRDLARTGEQIRQVSADLARGYRSEQATTDPVRHYIAEGMREKMFSLGEREESFGQSVQSLRVAVNGLDGAREIAGQIRALLAQAIPASPGERALLDGQVRTLFTQYDSLALDSSYQGVNLLASTRQSVSVAFFETSGVVLTVQGEDLRSAGLVGAEASEIRTSLTALGLPVASLSQLDSGTVSALGDVIGIVDDGIGTLRTRTQALAVRIDLLRSALDFTRNHAAGLGDGEARLSGIRNEEESARLVALRTRHDISLGALSVAGEAERLLLSLFSR